MATVRGGGTRQKQGRRPAARPRAKTSATKSRAVARAKARALPAGKRRNRSIAETSAATRSRARGAAVGRQRSPGAKTVARTRGTYVYFFGAGAADGRAEMKNLLGGKGANLAEMAGLGLPVPPGFTISTDVCSYYYAHDRTYPPALKKQVAANLARVESIVGRRFGDRDGPAAGLGPLRRARVDARHDGHGAEPRPQRRDRRGARERLGQRRGSRGTRTAASSRCTATSCSG